MYKFLHSYLSLLLWLFGEINYKYVSIDVVPMILPYFDGMFAP